MPLENRKIPGLDDALNSAKQTFSDKNTIGPIINTISGLISPFIQIFKIIVKHFFEIIGKIF